MISLRSSTVERSAVDLFVKQMFRSEKMKLNQASGSREVPSSILGAGIFYFNKGKGLKQYEKRSIIHTFNFEYPLG